MMRLSHRTALAGMLLTTFLWSTAGIVTRKIEAAQGLELTFWRSGFTALALSVFFLVSQGPARCRALLSQGRVLWLSGVNWFIMFTAFMIAMSWTTVANVLITLAMGPLLTALIARGWLGTHIPPRTWAAIALAGLGIGWMYAANLSADPTQLPGTLMAFLVPLAGAFNWNLLKRHEGEMDFTPALWIGAVMSALATLPFVLPFHATGADLAWLAYLGIFQLALPCLLSVILARYLPAPELALLALLEIIFGISWAWWLAGERPSDAVLWGGSLVLLTLAGNEMLGWWVKQRSARQS